MRIRSQSDNMHTAIASPRHTISQVTEPKKFIHETLKRKAADAHTSKMPDEKGKSSDLF